MVTEENLAEGRLYPPLSNIREVSFKIAVKVKQMLPAQSDPIDSVQSGNIKIFFLSHPFPPGVLGGELRVQTQHRVDLP